MHFFRMKLWLECIGKSHWLVERDEVYVYNNGRICAKHFSENAFNSTLKTKLIRFALPIDARKGSGNNVPTDDPATKNSTLYNLLTSIDVTKCVSAKSILEASTSNCPPSLPADSAPPLSENSPSPLPADCPTLPAKCPSVLPPRLDPEQVCVNHRTPKTKEIQRLRCANSKLKRKLYKAETWLKKGLDEQLKDKLTKRQYEFVTSQLKTGKVHPNGRRWTCKEKAFALNIYYKSANTYNALRKTYGLSLPCKNTLKKSTGNVAKDDGICTTIINALKLKTKEMKEDEKLCVLSFDEMSIKDSISYNPGLDKVDGFESSGTGELAKQSLVFMIRGLTKNWKQVII